MSSCQILLGDLMITDRLLGNEMTELMEKNTGEIVLYEGAKGKFRIEVKLQDETVWLTQAQMAKLFQKGRTTITEHIRNIFTEKELGESSVCRNFRHTASDGKEYTVQYYNLDVIISVGYRVKSNRGTQFRIWATNVLRNHLVQGYTLNEKRLIEDEKKRLRELEEAVALVKAAQTRKELTSVEAAGLLAVITDYTRTWLLLHQYDGRYTDRVGSEPGCPIRANTQRSDNGYC